MKTKLEKTKGLFLLLSLMLIVTYGFTATINVPGDYPTIQEALDAANSGDEIVVAADTYYENITWPATNGITLTGSGEETCFIDGSETASVIRFEENLGGIITNATLISGFTIQNGFAQGGQDEGGGVYIFEGSPSFENVTISNNKAYYGGGLSCMAWVVNFTKPTFYNVTFTDNESESFGGGILLTRGDATFENVTISNNLSNSSGGGLFAWVYSEVTLLNVSIINNSAIVGGSSAGKGGGIMFFPTAKLIMENVVIAGNFATNKGGGIDYTYYYGESTFKNVTISNNTSIHGGGIFLSINGENLNLENCIIWDNSPQEVEFGGGGEPIHLTVNYSDIKGGQAGIQTNGYGTVNWEEGNINADPWFCDPNNYVYTLAENSPCAGTGQNGENMGALEVDCLPVGIGEEFSEMNDYLQLRNYPNPFSSVTTISYQLPESGPVNLSIYNCTGQLVETLVNEIKTAGKHTIIWNADHQQSGLYFYNLTAGSQQFIQKMSLVK